MLIRAYGRFWNPHMVDWGSRGAGNQGSLKGTVKISGDAHSVDFWLAQGIYVLHSDFRPVYVGKAFGTRLGPRLRHHLTDHLQGRWDMFSWYTLSTLNKLTGTLRDPGARKLKPETVNNTLEAIAILVSNPPLNRRQESIPDAVEAEQASSSTKSIREYLEEILSRLP